MRRKCLFNSIFLSSSSGILLKSSPKKNCPTSSCSYTFFSSVWFVFGEFSLVVFRQWTYSLSLILSLSLSHPVSLKPQKMQKKTFKCHICQATSIICHWYVFLLVHNITKVGLISGKKELFGDLWNKTKTVNCDVMQTWNKAIEDRGKQENKCN